MTLTFKPQAIFKTALLGCAAMLAGVQPAEALQVPDGTEGRINVAFSSGPDTLVETFRQEFGVEIEPPPARHLEQMHIESMEMLAREPRGDQFDRAYIAGQVTAHDRVLELMRAAASREDRDTRLTAHLQSAIAIVEQHRDRARGVLEALGDSEDVSDR